MKLTLEQQYTLSVLHSQYYACWYSGGFRNQGISMHGIDSPKLEYSISSITRVEQSKTKMHKWDIVLHDLSILHIIIAHFSSYSNMQHMI